MCYNNLMNNTKNPTINNEQPAKETIFVLAFFLGVFGVHDFVVNRNKEGLIHLVLLIAPTFLYFVVQPLFNINFGLDGSSFLRILIALIVFNWGWAIYEAANYKQIKKEVRYYSEKNTDSPNDDSLPNEAEDTMLLQQKIRKRAKIVNRVAIFFNIITIFLGAFFDYVLFSPKSLGTSLGFVLFLFPTATSLLISIVFSIYSFFIKQSMEKTGVLDEKIAIGFRMTRLLFLVILLEVLVGLTSYI